MSNVSNLGPTGEYSDDEYVFQPPSQSELDDIDESNSLSNTYRYGSPTDGMKKLGNPKRHINEENLNYSIDYYYSKTNDVETFHIFRTLKPNRNEDAKNEPDYFPSIEYMKNIQKIQGECFMKLIEFNIPQKWIHFEYIPGGTIYDLIKVGYKFNFNSEIRILYLIANTINSLHQNGFLHLDIRLESIILSIEEKGKEIPILADVDMMVHQYKTRENYDDQYLLYLDPNFKSDNVNDSIRADIFSYGVMAYLFLICDIQMLEKSNIQNIKNAYSQFIKSDIKDENQKLNEYLKTVGFNFDIIFEDEIQNKLLKIAKKCIFGQIKSMNDLIFIEFKSLYKYEFEFNSLLNHNLNLNFALYNHHNDKNFTFDRSTFDLVEKSASYFSTTDIWLFNKRNEFVRRKITQRAAEASFYAITSGDVSLYEQILYEDANTK